MNAVKDAIANAAEVPNDNVRPISQAVAQGYPEATQKGFRIQSNSANQVELWRVPAGECERLVSGPVWIAGFARDADSRGWCSVVKYIDEDGNHRIWPMPRGLLAGDKTEVIRQLMDRGLHVAPTAKARHDLLEYVSQRAKDRFTTVERTGWHDGNFIFPDGVTSAGDEVKKYILLSPKPVTPSMGTLESWQGNIAARCAGNTRLVLAVSAAFATPLLDVAGVEGGGIHYVGQSSAGKTKALNVASTVFGVTVHSWRTTTNGLEATAAEHSDIGLLLDEIGQINPKEAGEAAYMLANGKGRVRARRDGTGKPAVTFRLITQTTGEVSLSEHMATVGQKAKAGQEVRILDIEADAGRGMGLFECLHSDATPQAFADAIDELVPLHRGHAGPAFVKYIIENRSLCEQRIKEIHLLFSEGNKLQEASGQVQRAAKRFALVAAAGELATDAGITGWSEFEALRAAGACFEVWRSNWTPSGNREAQRAIEQVRGFLQVQGARFITDGNPNPHNCAGYKQSAEHWIYPSAFKADVCADIRPIVVTTALLDAGHLITDNDGKTSARRNPDSKRQRFYVVSNSILEDDSSG